MLVSAAQNTFKLDSPVVSVLPLFINTHVFYGLLTIQPHGQAGLRAVDTSGQLPAL